MAVLKSGYACSHDGGTTFTYAAYLKTEPTAEQKPLFRNKTIGRNAAFSAYEFTLL